MLNLKHLYYFHIFAEELSNSKAANRLRITPSALSNQLKELGEFVGVPLSLRVGGQVALTDHGKMVLHYTEKMFSEYDELIAKLSMADLRSSRLRIGICQNLGGRFAFDLLSLIEKTNFDRSVNASLTFTSSASLVDGMQKNEFDLILGAFSTAFSTGIGASAHSLLFPVRLFISTGLLTKLEISESAATPMGAVELIRLVNAKKVPLIIPESASLLSEEIERFMASSGAQPERMIRCNSGGGITQLIERGFGMGFLPTPYLLDFVTPANIKILGPELGFWNHEVSLFVQKDIALSPKLISDVSKTSPTELNIRKLRALKY